MMIPIPYVIFSWQEPELTYQQKVELGHEVTSRGVEVFLKDYVKKIEEKSIEKMTPPKRKITYGDYIVLSIILFGLAVSTSEQLYVIGKKILIVSGVAIPVVMLFYYASLLYMKQKIRKWLSGLVECYAQSKL